MVSRRLLLLLLLLLRLHQSPLLLLIAPGLALKLLTSHSTVQEQQGPSLCTASASSGGGGPRTEDSSLDSDSEPVDVDRSLPHTRSAAFPSLMEKSVTVFSLSDMSPSSSSSINTNSLRNEIRSRRNPMCCIISAPDLVSSFVSADFHNVAIPGVHFKSHSEAVMLDLCTAAPWWRREGSAGTAATSSLLHRSVLMQNTKMEIHFKGVRLPGESFSLNTLQRRRQRTPSAPAEMPLHKNTQSIKCFNLFVPVSFIIQHILSASS
ncbi:uncharacterized protein LOC111609989 isoform X1 [Xiphophorus maculatus]|uniref:uncharacterized protein LOC111609989 isoform X1 n=2 Tax=Xiphophorus maculatus TaxID=8083 RepID=UPI000C6CD13E|nr:uncharacterized protein LOC111609989 isoform X1 [Xiphophorus maculatus]